MFYDFRCTSTARIPEYILIFDAIVNEIVVLILFLGYLFLVYRNKIEFSILLSYPATLLNLLVLNAFKQHTNGIEVQESCVCCILGTYLKEHYSSESSALSQNIVLISRKEI